jgi:hypothetical protein
MLFFVHRTHFRVPLSSAIGLAELPSRPQRGVGICRPAFFLRSEEAMNQLDRCAPEELFRHRETRVGLRPGQQY